MEMLVGNPNPRQKSNEFRWLGMQSVNAEICNWFWCDFKGSVSARTTKKKCDIS